MGNKRKVITALIAASLFVGAIAGTQFYYNSVINDRNSKVASLNNEIANLTSQISNLKNKLTNLTDIITDLTSANLVTDLGTYDFPAETENNVTYNSIYIGGQVTNTGDGIAYNAGLHIVSYFGNGIVETNMTVPLDSGVQYFSTNYQITPPQLSILDSGQLAQIGILIYYTGLAYNWTLTPVWTNSP